MQGGWAALHLSIHVDCTVCASLPRQAVAGGKWLLVEGIDSAPPEVLAALSPLLEGRSLHLSHRAQVIMAGPGFQFLATVTSAPGDHDTVLNDDTDTMCRTSSRPLYATCTQPSFKVCSCADGPAVNRFLMRAGGRGEAYSSAQVVHDMLGGLLATVNVATPPPDEQAAILEALFPSLAPLLRHALAMLAIVQGSSAQTDGCGCEPWRQPCYVQD